MLTWNYGGQGETVFADAYLTVPDPSRPGQLVYAASGVPVQVQDAGLIDVVDGLGSRDGQPVSVVTTGDYGVCVFTVTADAPPRKVRVSADGVIWTWLYAMEALDAAVGGGGASSAYVRAHTSDGRPVEIWALPHVATAADGLLDSSVNISVVTDS